MEPKAKVEVCAHIMPPHGARRVCRMLITVSLSGLAASGCALLSEPKTVPITQDYVGWWLGSRQRTAVFSTTAERRTVIVHARPGDGTFKVCAEPAADVAESVAKTLAAAIEAKVQERAAPASVEGQASLHYSFATAIVPLLYRSQGVQFFRDGLYNLCQAHLNGLVKTEEDFKALYSKLMELSSQLIAAEVPSVKQARDQMTLTETQAAATAARSAAEASKAALDASLKAKADAEAAAKAAKDAIKSEKIR